MPAANVNLEFALGNNVMVSAVNGKREYFDVAVRELVVGEAQQPGWTAIAPAGHAPVGAVAGNQLAFTC